MVHYVARRHRLNENETPLVHGLVMEKLRALLLDRRELWMAEEFFRLLWRMDHNRPGRPEYPEPFTWTTLEEYLTPSAESAEGLNDAKTEAGEAETNKFNESENFTVGNNGPLREVGAEADPP